MDLRSGVEKRQHGREVKDQLREILGSFDFRLLQQYLPTAEASRWVC